MNKLKIHPPGAYSPARGNKQVCERFHVRKGCVLGRRVEEEEAIFDRVSGKATAAGQILLQSRVKHMK